MSTSALTDAVATVPSEHFLRVWFINSKSDLHRGARAKYYKSGRDSQFDVLRLMCAPSPVELSVQKGASIEDVESDYTPCILYVMALNEVVLKMVRESLANGGLAKIVDWLEDKLRKDDSVRRYELIVTCDGKSVEYLTIEH